MARTINEIIATLPKADRDKIEARARELVAEQMTLRRLREVGGHPPPGGAR